ncbi:hypothetical protein [Histidinibacterium aquaticum]|uniref:Uncharacterized protein n=1 Tax=Histidinibacterium aquaticum TaxID=2613962 RepID=A0A5J5GR23_9RHOB|nr:hypothetical protein [Histidinibacterium aquaticum]KAA9010535.1 hypothetical protein F3S47_04635 [Histidinibacterium aquaticum]
MIRAGLALLLLAAPVAAERAPGGLDGREVTFGALLYEETEEAPLFLGARHAAKVGPGIEYGLGPEGAQNGWDIIPAVVDISDARVVITYPDMPRASFPDIEFNGYVLDFLTDCVLFRGASVDTAVTTEPLSDADVFVKGARLYIDVGGYHYGAGTTYAVDLDVMDCPIG